MCGLWGDVPLKFTKSCQVDRLTFAIQSAILHEAKAPVRICGRSRWSSWLTIFSVKREFSAPIPSLAFVTGIDPCDSQVRILGHLKTGIDHGLKTSVQKAASFKDDARFVRPVGFAAKVIVALLR
jgi:hypothetical protein